MTQWDRNDKGNLMLCVAVLLYLALKDVDAHASSWSAVVHLLLLVNVVGFALSSVLVRLMR